MNLTCSSNPVGAVCSRPKMKISCILIDVDGTMTKIRPDGRLPVNADIRLAELLAEKRHISADQALDSIHRLKDRDQHCIFTLAQKLDISEKRLWNVLQKDWIDYIYVPEDVIFFLKEMKRYKIPVYSATTNPPRMTLLKMSIGGLAGFDGTSFLAGFYSGNYFHDSRGKFAPDFFQKILADGRFDPEETVMIGDEYDHDCGPALDAGIRWTVLINRDSPKSFELAGGGLIRTNSLKYIPTCMVKEGI